MELLILWGASGAVICVGVAILGSIVVNVIVPLFAFTHQPFSTIGGFYSLKYESALYTNKVGGTTIGSRLCDIMIHREPRYVRSNTIPVFLSKRTHRENREDLWKLFEAR